MPLHRTRIKLCGLIQSADVNHTIVIGADAIGLVFYPPDPRYVTTERAAELAHRVDLFVTVAGLFVNASADDMARVLDQTPLILLQFHGNGPAELCTEIAGKAGLPWLRVLHVQPEVDLIEFADRFTVAQGLLLSAFIEGYDGSGYVFD